MFWRGGNVRGGLISLPLPSLAFAHLQQSTPPRNNVTGGEEGGRCSGAGGSMGVDGVGSCGGGAWVEGGV